MRVPRYDQQVSSRALPTPTARAESSGLQQLGGAIQQAAGVAARIAEDARQKEEARILTDLETADEQDWTELYHDDQNGLVAKRGAAAYTDGADQQVLAEAMKRSKARLEQVQSPRVRELYQARLAQRMDARHRQVEGYVGGQRRVAEVATVEARQATALDSIARNYAVPGERERLAVEVESSIRALAATSEAGEAAVAAWRKKTDTTVLNAYLQAGDVDGANAYLAQAKDRLGTDAARYEQSIGKAMLARKADRIAAGIIVKARDPRTGLFSEADARAAINGLTDIDKDTRDAVFDAIGPMLTNANALADAQKADVRNIARGLYNRGGLSAVRAHAMPDGTNLLDYLNQHDAEYEATLRRDAERKARRHQESRSEQNRRDAQALAEFRALDPEERLRVNVDDFGMQWGTSPLGTSTLRAEQQKSKGLVEKGHAAGERDFVRDAEIQATGLPDFTATQGGDQGKKVEARKKGLRAGAALEYSRFIEKNKREPDAKERQEMLDTLTTKKVVEEHWYGDDKEFGFESTLKSAQPGAPPAAPAPKTITKYLRSPDGTRRVPVYADGSFGPEETVR